MSMRKRVLVLTSTFPRWQRDRLPPFVFELSKRLARKFDVLVLAPHAPGAKYKEDMDGIRVIRFRYFVPRWQSLAYNGGILENLRERKWRYIFIPFFFLSQIAALFSILRKERIDVIHAHWLVPQGLVALTSRLMSSKPVIVCTCHGGDLFGLRGKIMSRVNGYVIRNVDRVTVVSSAMRDYAAELAQRNDIDVISMGVDVANVFTPDHTIERNPEELLFVGRLAEIKGLRFLVLAMGNILQEFPGATLKIIGSGPEEQMLRELAVETGVSASINFMGAIENEKLPEFYRRAAIFVMPSVREGFGLVLVEALACECPIVTTDLSALQDVIIDGVTGLVSRQQDSHDLAKKIISLLGSSDARKRLGTAGRQHVLKHFDWRNVTDRYMAIIDRTP